VRPSIFCLPGALMLMLAACDTESARAPQATAEAPAATPAPPPSAAAPGGAEPAGTLDMSQRGRPAPDDGFLDPGGAPVTLAAFRGRPVLVNLWATWCGPCVREMPTLETLAGRAEGKLKVLTVSQDRDGVDLAPTFEKGGFTRLERYRDPEQKLGFALGSGMLPTTVLYDAEGKEVWRIIGGLDWDGPRANTLLADYL